MPIDTRRLKGVGEVTLSREGCPDAEVTVLLVDDRRMARLNARYRGRPGPTDVLAFPAGPAPPGEATLGDIVISLDTARRQAGRLGHDLFREAATLLVHGLLHLRGYDHHTASGRRRMWGRQRAILNRFFAAP